MFVDLVGEKICTRCKHPKPLTDFRADSSKKDGRQSSCRACLDSTPRIPRPKRCACCGVVKPPGDFAKNSARVDGRGVYCRDCVSQNGLLVLRHKPDKLLRQCPVPAFNRGWIGWRLAA